MQQAIALAVRHAAPPKQTPGIRQSWRVQGVVTGAQPACPTLEAVIDERIAAGASVDDVMAIAHVVVEHTRRKLLAARPDLAALVATPEAAYLAEQEAQGPADVSQMRTLRERCTASLRESWRRLTRHRDALDFAIIATERAIQHDEALAATARARVGASPRKVG